MIGSGLYFESDRALIEKAVETLPQLSGMNSVDAIKTCQILSVLVGRVATICIEQNKDELLKQKDELIANIKRLCESPLIQN